MVVKTKNFNPNTDTKLLCTCGHDDCDKRSIRQAILYRVQLVRDDANRPLSITSGGRCEHHPYEVNKDKPGDHQYCVAVDIAYKTICERNELMVLAGRHGATAVAFGKNFVHMAWRLVPDSRVRTWEY